MSTEYIYHGQWIKSTEYLGNVNGISVELQRHHTNGNTKLGTYLEQISEMCSCWRSRNARLASAIAGVEFVRGEHDGGVAIAAWPMHSDQPSNAALVADVLKTEIVVREWKDRAGVVKASLIESVVRRFMASEEGCRIKETAEKLGAAVREATEAGGVSRIELDSFIAHVIR
ncbi:zeatin O-xylosyltransferase-like [Salvia splendens]|uniref:zeatin O-xylosyltransferase-like n=1 Tax=Salvia splendens TaxID=180675 RepID=UPI001104FC4B|nr:zeatin O-xylosyltransferase-like [Salvia splendens]